MSAWKNSETKKMENNKGGKVHRETRMVKSSLIRVLQTTVWQSLCTPSDPALGIFPTEMHICIHKDMHSCVYNSTILLANTGNCPNIFTTG